MRRLLLIVALLGASPALAGSNFAAYEGKDAVQDGQGGTKIVKDGIDFWTTGTPPHKYQILGVITDSRGTGILRGDAIGAPSIVKRIKDVGGSAAIIQGRSSEQTGAFVSNGIVGIARENTTQMLVVKYLD